MTELAAVVARRLAVNGVRQAFGVVGGGNILAVAGLTAGGVRYTAARHEAGAMTMADAYHRSTGDVAVCTTTHGAGLTNTATGLAEAVRHGSGVLLLCGDGPLTGMRRCDLDQSAFAASLGAEVVRVTAPELADAATAAALGLARDRSCPVVLCLPADLLAVDVPDPGSAADPAGVVLGPSRPAPLWPSEAELEPVLDLLSCARRPLVLAGLGAWRAGAGKELVDLGDRLGALLSTTVMANGLFAGSPWSVGICGGFSAPGAAELIGEADVVLAFGAGLDTFTLHGGRMIDPAAAVVRVDLARQAPGGRADLEVVADASATVTALIDGIDERGLEPVAWRAAAARRIAEAGWNHHPWTDAGTHDRIDPRTLTATVAAMLPRERTVVLDGGHFIAWPSMYLPVPDPAAMVFTGAAFQAVGQGFAGAVGAAAGRPDRLTVAALGDGGALMGLSELETLVRCGASALVVIYDDAAYGFEVHMYEPRGADRTTATFGLTDFAGMAVALGAEAATVRTVEDLEAVRGWCARGCPGTFVLDAKIVTGVLAPFLADLVAGH